MPIVRLLPEKDPRELAEGQVIVVYTDASTNALAIREVEEYCQEHALVRPKESVLGSGILADGTLVRRAACYRPYEDESTLKPVDYRESDRRVDNMPLTSSSVDLTRE